MDVLKLAPIGHARFRQGNPSPSTTLSLWNEKEKEEEARDNMEKSATVIIHEGANQNITSTRVLDHTNVNMYNEDGHTSSSTPPPPLICWSRSSAFSPVPRRQTLSFFSSSSPPVEAHHYYYRPHLLSPTPFSLCANPTHSFLSGEGSTLVPTPAPFPLSTNLMHPSLIDKGGVPDYQPPLIALSPGSTITNGSQSKGKATKHPTLRKSKAQRILKVPAISTKVSEIPSDGYSWRKYGHKPVKGSLYQRGYYRCNSDRGCRARKHVERAMDDPSMLIVTYVDDHKHEILMEPKRLLN